MLLAILEVLIGIGEDQRVCYESTAYQENGKALHIPAHQLRSVGLVPHLIILI